MYHTEFLKCLLSSERVKQKDRKLSNSGVITSELINIMNMSWVGAGVQKGEGR